MDIIFAKSKWEMWDAPLNQFLERVKKDGFDATEIYLNSLRVPVEEIVDLHNNYNLRTIGQILTEGENLKEHLFSLEKQAQLAVDCKSILVNVHPGKDFFSFDENKQILERLITLSKETGIQFLAETHRGRSTYSAIETKRYLNALPDLLLTADFSHWMVVHESDLRNQPENINAAIERSRHIHARVGYEEGPQVTDPSAPEWKEHLDNHLSIWKKIVEYNRHLGSEFLTITPEFGPPNYMHTLPVTNEPVRDTWEMNLKMTEILKKELQP